MRAAAALGGKQRMSVELHVFFSGKLPNKKALSQAMAELGFPFTIAAGSLERQQGFMPMRLRRQATGVELDVFNERAAVEELAGKDIDPSFDRSANFRWSGDEHEMLAGWCAAAALAKLVNGLVLDESDVNPISPDQAIALARQYLHDVLKPESGPQRRKAYDIKHYLEPLLRQRRDLVFVDGLLVIRPIRHIVRGAAFEKIRSGRSFRLYRFTCPLFDPREITRVTAILRVWEPHFEPLLMDVLANDIFDSAGSMTSIDEFAAGLPGLHRDKETLPLAFLLSGHRERAVAYMDNIESRNPTNPQLKPWYAKLRAFIARDVEDLCVHFRAKEAEAAKSLKLDRFWEPSPFPVELPAAERKARSDEPVFVPRPWIARPDWLLGDVPEQPGEVRFAKDWDLRGDKQVLIVPLSREQAEERHRNVEGYVLAARLTNGLLVLFRWDGEDRNHPDRLKPNDRDPANYAMRHIFELYGRHCSCRTSLFRSEMVSGTVLLDGVSVMRHQDETWGWYWSLRADEAKELIIDSRGDNARRSRIVTEEEIEQLKFAAPKFGEFETLAQLVLKQLRTKGFGELT